jgi:hypothetical protein
MRLNLSPEQARELLPRIDPGRVRSGLAVGLRDGALLALVAAGLSAVEIAALRASAVTMAGGHVTVAVERYGINWSVSLPTDLGARLLAWLTERRIWAQESPVFTGGKRSLKLEALYKILVRYNRPAPPRRRPR